MFIVFFQSYYYYYCCSGGTAVLDVVLELGSERGAALIYMGKRESFILQFIIVTHTHTHAIKHINLLRHVHLYRSWLTHAG